MVSKQGFSYRRLLLIPLFGGAAYSLYAVGTLLYANRHDQGLWLRLISFFIDWIPLALTIVVAFVPDLRRAPMKWRITIVSIGLIWSLLLVKKDLMTENEQSEAITKAINQAVKESNAHSEQHMGQQVDKLTKDFQEELHNATGGLSRQVSSGISELNQNLSKVGQPPEPKFAQIQFSLWDDQYVNFPKLFDTLEPDADNTYKVYWHGRNTSEVAAEDLEYWIHLCDDCKFASEPNGFERPAGSPERTRHKMFGLLNSGVETFKMEVDVKTGKRYDNFVVAITYSCKTCGKMSLSPQVLTLNVPRLKLPILSFPSSR